MKNIWASLNCVGKYPVAREALNNLMMCNPVFIGVCLRMSVEIVDGPVALLFILLKVSADSVSVIGFVKLLFLLSLFKYTVVCGFM